MMAIEGTAARTPPGEGEPLRGTRAPPQRQENPSPDAGEGGKANKCDGGMPLRRAMGEGGSVKLEIDPGEGEAPGWVAPLARGAGVRGLARAQVGRVGGRAEAERVRRHNSTSAPPSPTRPPVPRLFGCAPPLAPPPGALTVSARESVVQQRRPSPWFSLLDNSPRLAPHAPVPGGPSSPLAGGGWGSGSRAALHVLDGL